MVKQREFNITGPCVPSLHYMVDTDGMIDEIIREYVDLGKYFTLNRARQYGKTTTLVLLNRRLRERYIVLGLSFEGKDEYFASLFTLAEGLRQDVNDILAEQYAEQAFLFEKGIDERFPLRDLGKRIADLCKTTDNKVILLIDEVDKASDNQVFLSFLGMLREQYISRETWGTPAFRCVVLSGVHDIKNLKMKIRPEERHSYNSPWNIAASFDVDMSFSPPEIATMLNAYEADHHTGMDIERVSERLHYYTSGYPFLVSLLCKTMHDGGLEWTTSGVDESVNRVLKTNNTLFDDVIKNIMNHPSFGELVERIVLRGEEVIFEVSNPDIDLGSMFGILKNVNGKAGISNAIFETRILNYFISIADARDAIDSFVSADKPRFIRNGRLDMELVLNRFAAFMKSEYRDEDGGFLEREGRLLFLGFLKPIINGAGNYVLEAETRGSRRMDVVVFYGGEEQIVELKIWRGEQAASEAYDQLVGYLHSREQKRGYLLSFCDNLKSPREGRTLTHNGCEITEVIVAYRDKE